MAPRMDMMSKLRKLKSVRALCSPSTTARPPIKTAAVLVIFIAAVGKVLAFLRELLIAYKFGAGAETDAYLIASIIPVIMPLLVANSFNMVFIPMLIRFSLLADKAGKFVSVPPAERRWDALNSWLNFYLLISASFILFSILKADWLVQLLAPFFSEERFLLSKKLTQLAILSLSFSGAGVILTAALHAKKRFLLAAISELFPNLMVIFSALFFSSSLGIFSLPVGLISGEILRFFIQAQKLFLTGGFVTADNHCGWRYRFTLNWSIMNIKNTGIALLLLASIFIIDHDYATTDRILASAMPAGHLSAFTYAFRVLTLFRYTFAVGLGTVFLPTFTEMAATKKWSELAKLFQKGIRLLVFLALPFSVLLFIQKESIVSLIFQRGSFDATATFLTAIALRGLALQLAAGCVVSITLRAYYAIGERKIPFFFLSLNFVLSIILKLQFLRIYSLNGFAWASTIAMNVNAITLLAGLKKRIPALSLKRLSLFFLKVSAAAFGMFLGIEAFGQFIFPSLSLLNLTACVIVGVTLYLILCALFRVEELAWLWKRAR